jgi:hypothetical protein
MPPNELRELSAADWDLVVGAAGRSISPTDAGPALHALGVGVNGDDEAAGAEETGGAAGACAGEDFLEPEACGTPRTGTPRTGTPPATPLNNSSSGNSLCAWISFNSPSSR